MRDLRLDGDSLDLVPIGWVGVARDGAIAFTQDQDFSIRFFDASGAPLAKVGGQGSGPGEFRGINRAGWLADTLWVLHTGGRRVTLISPERTFVRTVALPSRVTPARADSTRYPPYPFVYFRAIYPDGSILASGGLAQGQPTPAGYDKDKSPLFRASLDGELRKIVGWMPRHPGIIEVNTATSFGSIVTPFSAGPLDVTSPDGSRTGFVITSIDGPNAGTFQLLVLNADGDTILSRRYPFTGVPIARHSADSVIAERIERTDNPAFKRAYASDVKVPSVYPPVAALLFGRDGTLWVRLRTTDEGRPWLVLDSLGEVLDTVVVSTASRVVVAERGTIWAVESDSNDVESLVRYKVTRKQ